MRIKSPRTNDPGFNITISPKLKSAVSIFLIYSPFSLLKTETLLSLTNLLLIFSISFIFRKYFTKNNNSKKNSLTDAYTHS